MDSIWLHWVLFINQEGTTVHSHRNIYLFQIWVCLFCLLGLSWPHYLGTYKMPDPQAWNTTQHSTPTREPTIQQKRCGRELMTMGSSGHITQCPIRSCQLESVGMVHLRHSWITSLEAILFKDRAPSFRTLSPGKTASVSLNYKLWLPREHFERLVPREQQARQRDTILWRVIAADQQER